MAEADASSHLSKACFIFVGGAVMARNYARRTKATTRASLRRRWAPLSKNGYVNSGDASVTMRSSVSNADALPQLIGKTPLVELKSLSRLTGNRIFAKCEFLNPGGSSKDRIAKQMVLEAEASGLLMKGGTIVEGTAGSTGISLSLMAASRGYKCRIVMPNDAAKEKTDLLKKFGASVQTVDPASIVNDMHYNNVAKKIAMTTEGAFLHRSV